MGARRRLCCGALLLVVLAGQLLLVAQLRGHQTLTERTVSGIAAVRGGIRQLVSAPEASASSGSASSDSASSGSESSGSASSDSASSGSATGPVTGAQSTPQSATSDNAAPNPAPSDGLRLMSAQSGGSATNIAGSDGPAPKSAPSDAGPAPKSAASDAGPAPRSAPNGAAPAPRSALSVEGVPSDPPSSVVLDGTPPHLIIILSSSPRSGSSLLGEILSTAPNTAYFFEPFYYHVKHNVSVSHLPGEEVQEVLRQLLTCRLERTPVLREAQFRRFIWRPVVKRAVTPSAATLTRRCAASTTRVVKLVRPRLWQLVPLLRDPELGPRIRLVHLVRDPRGTLNSQLHASDVWNRLGDNLTHYCDGVRSDLEAARGLSDPRYQRVHYEDLALRPEQVAVDLYQGMRLPQPPMLHAYFQRHMNSSGPPPEPRAQVLKVQGRAAGPVRWHGPPVPAERRADLAARKAALVRHKRSAPPAAGQKQLKETQKRSVSAAAGQKQQKTEKRPRPARPQELQMQKLFKQQRQQLQQQQQQQRLLKYREREKKNQYFSTYRGPDFDPYHWRKELKPQLLRELERHCGDVIAELQTEVTVAPSGSGDGSTR